MYFSIDGIVGRNLRRLREARGWSCADLASQVAIKADELCGYENGDARMPAAVIYALATCLEAPISCFFDVQVPAEASHYGLDRKPN